MQFHLLISQLMGYLNEKGMRDVVEKCRNVKVHEEAVKMHEK